MEKVVPALPTLCVINFNGKNVLPGTLQTAWALREQFAANLLVDNGSQDGSADAAVRDYPGITIVRLPNNLGAGGARNEGLRQAPTDQILFIDNDVALTAECVVRLREAMVRNPRAALAAATIVYAHRRDTIQYDGAECHFLGLQRLLDEDVPLQSRPPEVRKVGSLSTCGFMADRSRIPMGLEFDETYFYIFEDHDFGVRVRLLGAEVLSVTDAPCFHGSGTEGLSIRQLGTYSSKRVYYLIRNRWLLILKVFSLRTLLLLAPVLLLYELAQFGIVLKKGWFGEWWRAFTWIFANLGETLRKRSIVQRYRRVPDRQLLVGGGAPFRAELATGEFERWARGLLDSIVGSYWKLIAVFI